MGTLSEVYVKLDDDENIVQCSGGYSKHLIKDIENWILIDQGIGDKYNLCGSHYFNQLYDEKGKPLYKYIDGKCVKSVQNEE